MESNFRVRLKNADALHLEMLKRFCRLDRSLLVYTVGEINQDSVLGALQRGLSAQQIIGFLSFASHPRARLPDNVRIQIMLWERERDRLVVRPVKVVAWSDAEVADAQALERTRKQYRAYREKCQPGELVSEVALHQQADRSWVPPRLVIEREAAVRIYEEIRDEQAELRQRTAEAHSRSTGR